MSRRNRCKTLQDKNNAISYSNLWRAETSQVIWNVCCVRIFCQCHRLLNHSSAVVSANCCAWTANCWLNQQIRTIEFCNDADCNRGWELFPMGMRVISIHIQVFSHSYSHSDIWLDVCPIPMGFPFPVGIPFSWSSLMRSLLSSAGWAIHISWLKCCLCVPLDVNQAGTISVSNKL